MKKRFCVMIALLLCVCMTASGASALVIDGKGGVVRRGTYFNGDLSLTLPSSAWEEDSAVAYRDYDEIYFRGSADVNGFIPGIRLTIYDEPWDMDLDFEGLNISGDYIRVVDQNFKLGDLRVHYDCYFSSDGGTMELDYLTYFNCGDYGICIYYFTYSATRSIPDDLPGIDDMIESLYIEGVETEG